MILLLQVKPSSPVQTKLRTPAGAVNLQRSYEICRAVVEKSVNRAKVENQLVPPPAKQRKVGLPAGATIVVATSQPSSSSPSPSPSSSSSSPQQAKSFLAPRSCQPIAVRAVRLASPVPAPPSQQVLIQRTIVSGVSGLQQLSNLSQQAIVVRNNNPFSLQPPAGSSTAIPALPAPLQSSSAPVSYPALCCMLTPSVSTGTVSTMTATSQPGLNVAQFVSNTNNSFLSNSLNISNISLSPPTAPPSFSPSPARVSAASQQLIIYQTVAGGGQTGNKHFLIQQLPDKPPPCLQDSSLLTPTSPAKTVNPGLMIQQITKPCTPPPQQVSPLAARQQVVVRAVRPSLGDEKFTKPLPPIQTNPIKTVMKTTLLPRSPVSDQQINSILQQMMPEPAAQCKISPEEKEKASAVAAVAATNFEEGKLLSPPKMMSPQRSPLISPGPLIQPLELPENGSEVVEDDSSLDNLTIPEIPEELNNVEKEKEAAVPISNSRLILKVRDVLSLHASNVLPA